MRTETRTVTIGEKVGPIDWNYDFRQHYSTPTRGGWNPERMERDIVRLRRIAEAIDAGKRVMATTDGGWPRVGWYPVTDIGMHDGWPYWRPVPSVQLGSEWHSFASLTSIMIDDKDAS